uniref:Uncharacterized protein n=1 Tax=Rhodnius prolixus TaxID=13249 RepID=T1I718_RHOPR
MELVVKILDYLSYEEACTCAAVCEHFEEGVCYLFKLALIDLRRRIDTEMKACLIKLNNLPLNEEHLRMDYAKLLSFFRFLLTEMDLMFSLVWRFSTLNSAWCGVCPLLAPVLHEFHTKIEQRINVHGRHIQMNFNLPNTFPKWHEFLEHYDGTLCGQLNALMPRPIDFEIMAIDILTCCPSINFQIAFKRLIGGEETFNIYSFFKLNHLKPACQIPNVHNSQIDDKEKQRLLLKFLRESVQWENYAYLQEFLNEIFELEMRLWIMFDVGGRDALIQDLHSKYNDVQLSPYQPILKNVLITRTTEGKHWNEYYCRFNTYNESFTGLRCIIDTPNQKLEDLPLIFSVLRGWKHSALHKIVESEEMINFDNIGSHFNLISLEKRKKRNNLKFQLIIRYRERLFSTPAEAIVNVSYDEQAQSYITMDIIGSEPLQLGSGREPTPDVI